MGLDSREATPELTRVVVHLAAEIRSFERVESTTEKVLGHRVSDSTIRRLVQEVGHELARLEVPYSHSNGKEVVVPEAAVVSCDGGRIRTREPGHGRCVRLSGEKGWRETKNASFERMSRNKSHVDNVDPCETLATSFCSAKKVANLAGTAVPEATETAGESVEPSPERVKYEGPKRVLRTALSSMACSNDFGPMMAHEAKRRRFYESPLRVFIGDGLNWNWSIWKKHFPTFTPILDFIHAIQYVYAAAMAVADSELDGWKLYLRFVTLCWQGQVEQVIAELRRVCSSRNIDLDQTEKDSPTNP